MLLLIIHVQANAPDDPHPDWKFPLQFVCTSLQKYPQCTWASDKELEAAATKEITAIKALVQQCADNWPTDKWGEKDLSSVCVVTPTRLAVSTCSLLGVLTVHVTLCNLYWY